MTRIRTLDFLPSIFQTSTNSQFLAATLDQLVNPPVTKALDGYIGSKVGYGINANDYYVTEPTKERVDYQLEPGVVFTKKNESVAKDFISYPGILDALKQQFGITDNNNRLFESQFYSWDSFTNLDMLINYNQYYWLPEGPPAVTVAAATVFTENTYEVTALPNTYSIKTLGQGAGTENPTITLIRGGTYNFILDTTTEFWIQGQPGVTGYSPVQPNLYTRNIYGVTNNGNQSQSGVVTFNVPSADAQNNLNYPGNNVVGVVSTKPYSQVQGAKLSDIQDIDGVTSLNGRTLMFYNTGEVIFANDYFWTINFTGDPDDPTLDLIQGGSIPVEQKITPQYGTLYIDIPFVKTLAGAIEEIPYISAPLTTLYYQDGSNPNKVGVIKIIESNSQNTIDVITDILGKTNYTSSNGVVFTNGLKVTFDGDVLPRSYLTGEYYVEGVGTSIELIPTSELVVPEDYTDATSVPYDSLPYDIGNYDGNLFIPLNPDYITIARNSISRNAWSRSNRWFHLQVIQASAEYLGNPSILTTYANVKNKASRPIIEFYPNLKLFNSGTVAKNSVDFIDTRTTDVFSNVVNQAQFYPDVETYTAYTGSIQSNPIVPVGSFITGQKYSIDSLGTTTELTWQDLGSTLVLDGDFIPGIDYIIWDPGTPGITDWATITGLPGPFVKGTKFTALTPGVTTGAGSGSALTRNFTANFDGQYNSGDCVAGSEYFITNYGTTPWTNIGAVTILITAATIGEIYFIRSLGAIPQRTWNQLAGTTGIVYKPGDKFVPVSIPTFGNAELVKEKFTATGSNVGTGIAYQGTGAAVSLTTTTLTIDSDDVYGNLVTGMYINDMILGAQSILPPDTRIYSIEGTNTYNITVFWPIPTLIGSTTNNASFAANTKNNIDLALYNGARIVFAAETNPEIKNKIYVVNFSVIDELYPVITLTEALDGQMLENDQFVLLRGQINQGNSFYFDGTNYVLAQQKTDVNQQPKFDVFDKNGISFGDESIYESTNFIGNDLFRYRVGTGVNDSILGFPISYSSLNNVGDITFDVALNIDEFNYVSGAVTNEPVVQKVNTGFVHNYTSRTDFNMLLGWQTAVAPSVQYQVFEFPYTPNNPPLLVDESQELIFTVTCDVGVLDREITVWPNLQVYNNNNLLLEGTDYTVEYNTNSTIINVSLPSDTKTEIQVFVLSNQVSTNAYYSIPINLSNNPFNTDVTTVDIGDIRGHYQTIFYNNPNASGVVFGSNNTRDLGNIVPYGTKIIQNSASFVLPGAFLRNSNYNLFNALEYNSREYVKFKTLLVDTINNTSYQQKFNPSFILDDALDQIASVKNQDMPFFWSDMLPNKAAYITNIYTLANDILTSTFPLSKTYNFSSANYNGVLVYIESVVDGINNVRQLYKDIDYTVSVDSPSVTITKPLTKGTKIIVKEYNQTYGSFVPNTPTKLGLYPLHIPKVVYDTSYQSPTYFILGHDGSYTKLYGEYLPDLDLLVDYRDQGLLEFETRIYNNIKLSNTIPIQDVDIIPGFFRNTSFSYDEFTRMYSTQFLNWIGQNRLDYKTQLYAASNPWTYNYRNSRNKLDDSIVQQGNWRGIYEYFYDTSTPEQTPWEMLGYPNKPIWWESRYGAAPYTSDNLILWTDLSNGYDYNNGNPRLLLEYARPGLLNIIPVDSEGNLVNPFETVIGNYNSNTLQKDWMVGDDAPVEFSYRRSSTYPFDLMRLYALMQPTNFFNLAVDLDNYKYDETFNQFLYNGRSHLVPSQVQIYGNGTAKTSYVNWIVDYVKQIGLGATEKIEELLFNLDVRLVYRLAGFSDKAMLKFFVEKGTPESRNASLLIPDESYSVLLYENQPYSRIVYSSVVVQLEPKGFRVYGNSQNIAYFPVLKPVLNGNVKEVIVQDQVVEIAKDYTTTVEYVPYGTLYYTTQELSQFLMNYGTYLQSQGLIFDNIEAGIEINWEQMVAEFLYWAQVGWTTGSILTLNPAAETLHINKESTIVQPLTLQQTNFILNQNLYPIDNKDLAIVREGSKFTATALNPGDAISYGQFNMSNIEHGIVFDNITLFNDVIYNLQSGLKQNRMYVRGTKSAEWNGTMFASGFIYNQDNVQEWTGDIKYTKGAIVKYKNKYWTALKIIQPATRFNELDWKQTEYDEIQKGLLPNPSTRSYESTLYYNIDKANLETDADQLSFSLIGFRPRPYMASADLTDITQVNVYKNLIKEKGTRATLDAFKGANLPQGGIDYDVYENWAILTGEFGGVLNNNFIEFKISESKLTANPSIVALTNGNDVDGAEQLIPIYSLFNYGRLISNTNVLPTISEYTPNTVYPDAGYVNIDDVKMSAYFYSNLPSATNKNGLIVPIDNFYVNDYVWIANYLSKWQILTPYSVGQVLQIRSNLNGTGTLFFEKPHNLTQYSIFSIVNFDDRVNGYYIAQEIINPYQILINLPLDNSNVLNRQITGQGIALAFNSQRVDKPSDIQNLPLLNYEFTKNKVWVDENTDGGWGVYRKSINYKLDQEFTRENSLKFGSAVNYTTRGDFLISDPNRGTVYRYQYDAYTGEYATDQTLIVGLSGGTAIVSAENIIVVSKPKGNIPNQRNIIIYVVNNTDVSDDLVPYQNSSLTAPIFPVVIAPLGCNNFGQAMAFSDDTNYLFVSDFDAEQVTVNANAIVAGFVYTIKTVGTTNWVAIGAPSATVGVTFTATGPGFGSGTALKQISNKVYVYRKNNIELPASSIVTYQTYQILEVGDTDYTLLGAVENKVGIYFTAVPPPIGFDYGNGKVTQCNYQLVHTITGPTTKPDQFAYSLSTNYNGNVLVVGAPYEDYDEYNFANNWGRSYVYQRLLENFEVEETGANQQFTLCWAPDTTKPLTVLVNGTYLQAVNYTLVGSTLTISNNLIVGDIIEVIGNEYTLVQILETGQTPRVGTHFGNSVASNKYGTEILVGAPFQLTNNQEGAVYRYTDAGSRFGYVTGISEVAITTPRTLLLNGYKVTIPVGDADLAARTIVSANITNITATASNNILTIGLINQNLAQVNQELQIGVTDIATLAELGLQLYNPTQTILCPHEVGATQFGTTIKFNEHNSFVVSAPVGTRFALTTFDFTDDENLDNDTVFDNNATQFLDTFNNAGAVYMYDYLENYNENLNNIGAYTYAQSCNAQNLVNGQQPYYGTALDFTENIVVIGTPNYRPEDIDGQVIVYVNDLGVSNWSLYRQSNPIVDIRRIQNTQLFSAETNKTLINLDYMDPLQGKLLGAISQNINVVSNVDPATYNNSNNTQSGFVWGAAQVGTTWYDTTNVRYINYHQNDNNYNARYWGAIFPGSDPAVYTWIGSNTPPANYTGPGIPRDISLFTVQTGVNASNQVQPIYYFWARNTGFIIGNKTLSDSTLEDYISNPQGTGISYMSPIRPDAYALYNCEPYYNANDTVFHLGYSSTQNDDPGHQEFCLIRENYESDFLPGLPNINKGINVPESLYDRLLDSLSGTDEIGSVVPDPFLPKTVQSGILARPRQSFFYNRYTALQNYLEYVNAVLKLYPISELRRPTYLNESGTYYNVSDFWQYVNWWAVGYDDNTKSAFQVPFYADLSALDVASGTIVTVSQNSQGFAETYLYEGNSVWTRIGLQNGTIKFNSELYNYNLGKFGFGGDFFSTTPFDLYPSEETRWIIRAINEQIFTNELLIFRNKGLILLFEYIQSESNENQNYLPWLNKTSLVDVAHKIRELKPLENYQSDNQEFLSGYVNEAKPYHVVVKEFLFDYTGQDIYQGNITDFDLPATYDTTINKFVSPQLVYTNPNTEYEFLPDDPVWSKEEYNEWYNNYGVSLVGQPNYLITTLDSYVTLNSDFIIVKNAAGFPINGVIKIADIANPNRFEYISYYNVDRALNTLSGLVRGVYGSEVFDHIPGENIYIDLPSVVVLDGGRNYNNPPKVRAVIDLSVYPPPKEEAVLEAVMSLDTVVSINVINPGVGYAVLPEIIIDPSQIFEFESTKVNTTSNTIEVYAPTLQTGDLIRYVSGIDNVGGLENGQYYYINVLDTTPTSIIALFTTYADAINNTHRVKILSQGSGTQTFELGAKASAVSSSYPIRENNITLRYDRTTYNSNLIDWEPGRFYSGGFAGSYNNIESVASSDLSLQSLYPEINNILASDGGLLFPIQNVENERIIEWSNFERDISSTVGGTDVITLNVDYTTENASGSTIGFVVGMPVKFVGTTGTSGLVSGTTYYIKEIVSETQFKISATQYGSVFDLSNYTVPSNGLKCFTAQIKDTALLTVRYPGIREVTATSNTNNTFTVPLSPIGTGGTEGMYTGMPVMFTGNVFGGIEDNVVYYITSVLDKQTFTIGETDTPITIESTAINAANQIILANTIGLNVNDKIVFGAMVINGIDVTSFGGINRGQIYYIREIGVNIITISLTSGGSELSLSPVTAGSNTYAYLTSQEDTVDVTTATGSMIVNLQLPVSPGQVNEQKFTLYQTSEQFADLVPTNYGNLVSKTIEQILAVPNVIALETDVSRLYNGFGFRVPENVGGLFTNKTYYLSDINNIELECTEAQTTTSIINASFADEIMTVTSVSGSGLLYPGTVISGTSIDNLYIVEYISGTGGVGTYKVSYDFFSPESFTGLTASTGIVSAALGMTTDWIYENMPITFSKDFGSIIEGEQYYVRYVIDTSNFIITEVINSASVLLTPKLGVTVATGSPSAQVYLNAGDFVVGNQYDINFIGTTNFTTLGATLAQNDAGGFVIGEEYIINNLGSTTNFNWNQLAGTVGVTYKVNDIFVAVKTDSGSGNGTAYKTRFTATGAGSGTGSAIVVLSNYTDTTTLSQYISQYPLVDVSYIAGGYKVVINNGGEGFTVDNTMTISGALLNGTSPANDLTLTVNQINPIIEGEYSWSLPIESDGEITSFICTGEPAGVVDQYYLKVRNADTFEVYSDPKCTMPVSGLTLPYTGFTTTTVTSAASTLTVSNAADFSINDAVAFTGSVFGNVVLGSVYYIIGINYGTNVVTISTTPNGTAFDAGIATGLMTMAKAGAFAVLPQPFYFNESIVKYNNRVYVCVVSNNDDDFIFGKWQLIGSDDSRLNALDRIQGFYAPSINMPGKELQQLVSGITYPNTIYKGNVFDPISQYEIDTNLQNQPFYPTNVNMVAVVFNGINYIAPANTPNYSAFAADIEVTDDWLLGKFSDKPLAITDLVKANGNFVMTSTNTATPLFISGNGESWSTNGFYVPYGTIEEDIPYVKTRLISSNLSLNSIAYGNGKYVAVGSNIITSDNLALWKETFIFSELGSLSGNLYGVQYVDTTFFTGFIAVGYKDGTKVILYSVDGESWTEVTGSFNYNGYSPAEQDATLYGVAYDNDSIVVVGDLGVIYRATALANWTLVQVVAKPMYNALYRNNLYVVVGEDGFVYKSTDGITWTSINSPVLENLNAINYEPSNNTWTIVGDNNTVLQTTNMSTVPVVWDTTQIFSTPNPAYTIQGDPFQAGYGPEELVPGVVTDQLTMIVTTRPGTNWDATQYAHVGYDVVSLELEANTDNIYSFANIVQVPAQVAVYLTVNGISTALYVDKDYTVNWVKKYIELNTNISAPNSLRVDVYEVGNGDQLVKSNTDNEPIVVNSTTGFSEIYLSCNYSGQIMTGGGIVQPTTGIVDDTAIQSSSADNTFTVTDTTQFVLNGEIYFEGTAFGGVSTNTPYFVKSINPNRSAITISSTLVAGIAGPVFTLTDAVGNMTVIIETGPGEFYTEPAIYHNGTKLVSGRTNLVIRSKSSTNSFVTYSTVGLIENSPIVFGDGIVGGVTPHTTYYIKTILSTTEFTVSATVGGSTVTLVDQVGTTSFVTEDYAASIAGDGITAKIIFSKEYNANHIIDPKLPKVDYLAFSFFNETDPVQYGYTIPETQVFVGNNSDVYDLTNYITENSAENAVVEINGLRLMPNEYSISPAFNNITFNSLTPDANTTIAVTTYNDTARQYLNTQSELSDTQVTPVSTILNSINPYYFETQTTTVTTVSGTRYFVADTNSGLVNGQYVMFQGSSAFGGVQLDGTVYTLVYSGTGYNFRVQDNNGNYYPSTTGSGLMNLRVGGQPTVRIITSTNHNLVTNDVVRIDGLKGSVQLNNQSFFVHVITPTVFDIYTQEFDPNLDAVNYPVTICDSYISGGYIWEANSFILYTTMASETIANEIHVASAENLVLGTPVLFTESNILIGQPTSIPEIIAGEIYYINSIDLIDNTFTVSATRGGATLTLTTTGLFNIRVSQWQQNNVDRLWVTVNGYRVPSSSLRINAGNQISILAPINIGDEIIITSMMPSATPDQETYLQLVDSEGNGSVFRANNNTRTWITKALGEYDTTMQVDDISKITNNNVQTNTAPAAVLGYHTILLNATKNDIVSITVYNNNPARLGYIEQDFLQLEVIGTGPYVKITEGDWIEAGDILTIETLEGKLIYINGEFLRIENVDTDTNICDVARGVYGTGVPTYTPKYSEVYSLLEDNKMSQINYDDTWNKIPGIYNVTQGDPLQIADSAGARFLRVDD